MKLSRDSVERAVSFIMESARPLEKAMFNHRFRGGSTGEVLAAMAPFQNSDGGFGHGLEPDLRLAESSALCTTSALDILVDLGIPGDDPLVTRAISYLLKTHDAATHVWPIVPDSAEASPHAPWWNRAGLKETFGHFMVNPRAKICGYLFHYPELNPEPFRRDLLTRILDRLATEEEAVPGDTLLNYLALSQCMHLPVDARARLEKSLVTMIPASVETEESRWDAYCLKPIWVVKSPHSPHLSHFPDALQRNLDYEIEHQEEDGSWKPFWSWAGSYPESWAVAEVEWRGLLTLGMLTVMAAFDRFPRAQARIFQK